MIDGNQFIRLTLDQVTEKWKKEKNIGLKNIGKIGWQLVENVIGWQLVEKVIGWHSQSLDDKLEKKWKICPTSIMDLQKRQTRYNYSMHKKRFD